MHAWTERKKNALIQGTKCMAKGMKAKGTMYEPWEVGVGELLLAVLPPLVPVVIRSVSVRGPGALIFPGVFFYRTEIEEKAL